MNILVTGATGLIGSTLSEHLISEGHQVSRLTRLREPSPELGAHWVPEQGLVHLTGAGRIDAVVHLAGEPIVGSWTEEKKQRIRASRVQGTELLCRALVQLPKPPSTLVSASAIGYYGDRGSDILTEDSPPGSGFLPTLCRDWEAATAMATEHGIRVVNLRIGLVLSPAGGVLKQMLTPFRYGLGSILGGGRQYMSWVAMDDLVGIIEHVLEHERVRGPVNAVDPAPVTNAEFTQTLGRVIHRLTPFVAPAGVLRLMFGQMADELLLSSARVEPTRLVSSGYVFKYPHLEGALRRLLRKP